MSSETSPEAMLARLYDEGVAAYDEHWAPALNRHSRDLVASIPACDDDAVCTVLDVAAGSGTLVPALRELAGRNGLVVALDRSHGMLTNAPDGVPRVQGDAARLPFGDATADVVVFGFVLFLLPDARLAVSEATRVLRPGGWLLAATWGNQLPTGADVIVREELDDVGAPAFPDLPRSDALTDSPEKMATLLGGAGLGQVHTTSRPLDALFDARAALAMRTGCGALGWRYARLDQDAREHVQKRALTRLRDLPDDAFIDRSEVLLTAARRF